MAQDERGFGYEKPVVSDFGSLWDNTFLNPGGHLKLNGSNFDAHLELAGNDGS
jgi:hypothetical protein